MKVNQIVLAKEPASASRQSQTNPPHRILVVDDEPYIRHLNARALIRFGYRVDAAEDGAAAWEALSADTYDLLITDHNMPKVTGVQLLKKLRAARMALPVIMVTATVPQAEFNLYPWLKPAATLLKPYTMEDLLGTVEKVLRVTDDVRDQSARQPDWQSQPSTEGWMI